MAKRQPLPQIMRAYKIHVKGWGDDPLAVIIASSRGKAIARAYAGASSAGYMVTWREFSAVRAPEFDSWFPIHGAFSWSWEHVQKMAQEVEELIGRFANSCTDGRTNNGRQLVTNQEV